MDWIDITRPIEVGMRVYSDEESFERVQRHRMDRDGYNLSLLRMGAHCGTHMDAPTHFLAGAESIECAPLDLLMGEALVVTARDDGDFAQVPDGTRRLLLRSDGFSGLTVAQAQMLLNKGVQLLGTDRLSSAPEYNEMEIHKLLLGGGAWLIESLLLDGIADGRYELCCLPLRIMGCEGAPARAVLRACLATVNIP